MLSMTNFDALNDHTNHENQNAIQINTSIDSDFATDDAEPSKSTKTNQADKSSQFKLNKILLNDLEQNIDQNGHRINSEANGIDNSRTANSTPIIKIASNVSANLNFMESSETKPELKTRLHNGNKQGKNSNIAGNNYDTDKKHFTNSFNIDILSIDLNSPIESQPAAKNPKKKLRVESKNDNCIDFKNAPPSQTILSSSEPSQIRLTNLSSEIKQTSDDDVVCISKPTKFSEKTYRKQIPKPIINEIVELDKDKSDDDLEIISTVMQPAISYKNPLINTDIDFYTDNLQQNRILTFPTNSNNFSKFKYSLFDDIDTCLPKPPLVFHPDDPNVVVEALMAKLQCPICYRGFRRKQCMTQFSLELESKRIKNQLNTTDSKFTVQDLQKDVINNEQETSEIRVGKCGHVYCKDCIVKLVIKKKKCPVCNQPLSSRQLYPLYMDLLF